jgi:hypothetical protein
VGFEKSEVSKRQRIGVDGDRRGDDPITLSQLLQPAGYQSTA